MTRSRLLPAYVEIMAAGQDLPAAMEGATVLVEIAERPRDISHLPVDPCDTDIPQRARICPDLGDDAEVGDRGDVDADRRFPGFPRPVMGSGATCAAGGSGVKA